MHCDTRARLQSNIITNNSETVINRTQDSEKRSNSTHLWIKMRRRGRMGNKYLKFLTAVTIFLSTIANTLAAGYFELQILEISNTNNHLLNGYCCGVSLQRRLTETTNCPPCETAFRLCLKEYQSAQQQSDISGMVGCAFGNATTATLGGSSFVMSEPEVGALILPFTFRWTKSFTLILQALDMYNTSYAVSEQLIEETSYSDVILPSPEWRTLDHVGKNARITYRIRVQCSNNYYNSTCTIFCRPRNDQFGHHECGEQGNKVCLPGWQGTNCERAICKAGCDPAHGSCAHPGGCECRPGWRGPLCNECMVYPGCAHGYCNGVAWQCICDTNWGGILCDQDLNYCGTHEPCMHGGTCENTAPDQYRCTCPDGLSGNRCEIIEHPCATRPCKNGGTCLLQNSSMYSNNKEMVKSNKAVVAKNATKSTEFTCTCAVGWTGPACEINIDECAGNPCEHGGKCEDLVGGFKCKCPSEWQGDYCQIDVDECETNKPCNNAKSCTNTPGSFQCDCLDGWGGVSCTENLNDCIGQCKNGATCVDKVNDYHCVCAAGYAGRDCSTDVDECAHSPCQNGGECVDLIGSFRCICPVGYSGTLCEAARDHCSPSPCVDGSCMNTAEGYYCHCPIGRSGKHCELLRTPCQNPPCNDKCSQPTNDTNVTPLTCNGRGKCEMGATGVYCVCQQGFAGTYCQENINECISNPCKNGGICNDGDGNFICKCLAGWNGLTCTEKATHCVQGQCMNGGSCIPSVLGGISQCRCSIGWGGPFCNEPLDQCLGQPCHNGGTCETGTGWFRCLCANGFSGPDCRINVNECAPQPCLGGGTCIDGIGSFTCTCPPGRRGTRCEILLSDPSSVCASSESGVTFEDTSRTADNTSCNSCICLNGKPHCSNLWCGLPNCLSKKRINSDCQQYEVCVPTSQETCLSPPCNPKGDCRSLEPSRRVAPPSYPAPVDCWPNQAVLDDQCSRVSVLLELSQLPKGSSVDTLCHSLRTLLGEKLLQSSKSIANTLLVLLCDIKNGTNDTLEMTISSPPRGKVGSEAIKTAVRHLEELFSRSIKTLESSFFLEHPEARPLSAILEIKVETESIRNEHTSFFLASVLGIGVVVLLCGGCLLVMWRQRFSALTGSGVNLAPSLDSSRFEEEKHNNLQNEENIRRYANPLKGSIPTIHSAMELNFSPTPDVAQLSHSHIAGHSSQQHRSQILYPGGDADYDKDLEHLKSHHHHRRSQHLLYKTQNTDMSKNTENWVEIKNKIPKNIVL